VVKHWHRLSSGDILEVSILEGTQNLAGHIPEESAVADPAFEQRVGLDVL